jgi:TRAP-type C4-dicarboxylate transport system permease small subunit
MNGSSESFLVRLNGRVTLWLARIAAVVLALIALMTFSDVFGRYIFNKPYSFTFEVTELAMGIIVFFGLGLVTHTEGHISVDILTIRMREKMRAFFAAATNVVALIYLVLLVWRVFLRAEELHFGGDKTQILLWELWPHAYVMAFGSLFLLTGIALLTINAVRDLSRRKDG